MSELDVLRQRAIELVKANNWGDAAVQANEQILAVAPNDVDSQLRLAKCHELLGNLQQAYDFYSRALTLRPGNRIAENGLERIEQKLRQANQLEGLRRIRSYGQAFAVAQDARHCGDLNREIAALLRACELDRRPEALTMLAAAYRRCQRWADAERLYEEVLTLHDTPVARVGLAAVYRDQRRLQEARSILEKVLRGNPNNGYALRALAGVYSDLEKPEEANRAMARAAVLGYSDETRF